MVSLVVHTTSVVHEEGAETISMGRATGLLLFFQVISYATSRFLCKDFSSPPAISYDRFWSAPCNRL